MISERPVVVGLGMCSSCGSDYNAAFDSLVSKKDFLQTQNLFDSPKHAHRLFAVAKGFNTGKKHYSRCANIMLEAVSSAMSGLNLSGLDKHRISVFVGTSIGGVYETENALVKLLLEDSEELGPLRFYECSTLSDIAAKKIGAKGCAMTFSTACSSSSLALSAACNAIAQKEADLCLVCGVDALSRITVNGFGSLLLLSADKCKPFDKHRDGITLGEAAGAQDGVQAQIEVRDDVAYQDDHHIIVCIRERLLACAEEIEYRVEEQQEDDREGKPQQHV